MRKWRHLARTLGVTDSQIDRLDQQYRTDVHEQVRRALMLWAGRPGAQATRARLIDALVNCDLRLLADQLQSLELH